MTQETKETIKKLGRVKTWDGNGTMRWYLQAKNFAKAGVLFSEMPQNARYIYKVPGGFLHAAKSYNGWTRKELGDLGFPGLELAEV